MLVVDFGFRFWFCYIKKAVSHVASGDKCFSITKNTFAEQGQSISDVNCDHTIYKQVEHWSREIISSITIYLI